MQAGPVVVRYAKALFAIAKEKGKVEDFGREVEFLGELFTDPALQTFLSNPWVSREERKKLVLDKIGPHVSDMVRNFVGVLFDSGREQALLGVPRAYRKIAQESLGQIDGVVESAKELAEEQRKELEKALSSKLGLKVQLKTKIKPELIGGLRVTVGHRRFDSTVAAQLKQLRSRLLDVPIDASSQKD